MRKQGKNRHIMGYIVGILIFGVIIPFLIYFIPQIGHPIFKIQIMNFDIIRFIIIIPLFVVGLAFTIWSNINLLKIGKGGPTDVFNIEISPRSKKLVTTGPYRFTRNLMVFGVNSIYFGIAFFANSLLSLLFCISFLFVIVLYIKFTEEKRLLNDFGDEYLDYKKRVSMIIPFKNL